MWKSMCLRTRRSNARALMGMGPTAASKPLVGPPLPQSFSLRAFTLGNLNWAEETAKSWLDSWYFQSSRRWAASKRKILFF